MASSIVFLMYHELEVPGRRLCQDEPGYVRYVVHSSAFETQMQWLHRISCRGVSVSQALEFPDRPCVALTFDDGSETDLVTAAPILDGLAFTATFYITTGFLGKRGYLSRQQLRELSDAGFEIGCHSMTHPYLSDLSEGDLNREMLEPRKRLEDIVGKPVEHFSCPGGRYNRKVQLIAQRGGYRTLSTSRVWPNSLDTDLFQLGRVVIMRDSRLSDFQRICRKQGLWRLRTTDAIRSGIKKVIGNLAYDAIRALLLRAYNGSSPS